MIHPDCAKAAAAISDTLQIAEDLGQLPAALPHALLLLTSGLVIALREMKLHQLDAELRR